MKLIKNAQLVAAIVGLAHTIASASNGNATTATFMLTCISALVLIRMQIERAKKV